MRPTLFVPVENQVRELDAKLLFACVAARHGYPVVLGRKQLLYFALPRFAPGIFIAKSMRARSKLMFDIARGLGHEVVAWDEESLVRFDSPEYFTWRFSPATFNAISHLFAWGEDDAAMFAAYPGNRGVHIHATGNPRLDLLRAPLRPLFAAECAALRERHGDYILVNTNFSFVNPFVRMNALVPPKRRFGRRRSRTAFGLSEDFAAGMAAHQQQLFDHFRVLLPALAERFPGRTIVLRPHPSEDHDVWRRLLAGHPNLEVRHEGNVIPWLMSAAVLVHNGCTTAVEGAVVGCPAVSYRPVRSATFDYALPNGLSHQADSVDDVLEAVAGIVERGLPAVSDATRQHLFQRHLAAADGPLAAERIVRTLDQFDIRPPGAGMLERSVTRLKCDARTAIKRINMRRQGHWASDSYGRHVFPGVTLAALEQRVAVLGALLGAAGDVAVEACGDSVFRIAARGAGGPGARTEADPK
ncbi:MAG: hypothetical protein RLW42_05220, partial [Gammaproteobacteria bacterium]